MNELEQIKELKRQIDDLEYKINNKDPEFKEGDYVIDKIGRVSRVVHATATNVSLRNLSGDGLRFDSPKILRIANKEEIEQALIKEAKRRGLVDGSYGHLKSYAREFTGDYHLHLDWEYGHDILCIGHDWIWSSEEGWAEVIEPKLTIAGYEVEESNYDIRIGCTSLPKDTLIKFFEVRDRAKREGIDLYSEEVDKLKELL